MNLPPSLQPWARELEIFPPEISLAIGQMASRIAPFVGQMPVSANVPGGEPDGFDGIARRGNYTRLLLSELALADELPDEFLRRAAMNEHLFLQLARVEPSSKRVSAALFDCGVEQLGAPRTAHLAALIVLAKRAADANSQFLWGVLQQSKNELFETVTPENVNFLLQARTAENVTNETLEIWLNKFAEISDLNDFWLVGGESLSTFSNAKTFSRLIISEVLEPEARQLAVNLHSASSHSKSIVLDLPEPALCTRLLRNPFANNRPKTEFADLGRENASNMLFSEQGSKLIVRFGDKSIGLFNVPNSPNAAGAYPKTYRYHGRISAAGQWNQSLPIIWAINENVFRLDYVKFGKFRLASGNYENENAATAKFALPADDSVLLPCFNLHINKKLTPKIAVLDAENNLFQFSESPSVEIGETTAKNAPQIKLTGKIKLRASNVLAVARLPQTLVFVGIEAGTNEMSIISLDSETDKAFVPQNVIRAFFGYGSHGGNPFGLPVWTANNNDWTIFINDQNEIDLPQAKNCTVFGAYQNPAFDSSIGLLELDDDRRTVFFNANVRRKHIFTADDEIESIIQSQRSPLIAYRTVLNEIIVYSVTHRAEVCRYKLAA